MKTNGVAIEPTSQKPDMGHPHPGAVEVVMLPLKSLLPSRHNPRRTMDATALGELVGSIQAHGIQVPLLVRDEPGSYEIISGHRRHKAAELAGLIDVPCIVRQMSDAEAREIQIVENLQREDLPPLEEADAYQALLANLGTVSSVAARVGKPIEYVTRRLKLNALIMHSCDAFRRRLLTIDHAMLLCKLAPAEQEQALRYVLDRNAAQKVTTQALMDAKAEEEKRIQKQAALKIERELRLNLASKAIVATTELRMPALRALLTALYVDVDEDARDVYPAAEASIESPIQSVQFAKLISALYIAGNLHINSWRDAEVGRKEFIAACKVLGVDASKAWAKPVQPAKKAVVQKAVKKAVKKAAKK